MKRILTIVMVLVSMIGFAAPMKLQPAQQKNFNTFFSNFSESSVESFKQGALTDEAMLAFALSHLYKNKFKSLKKSKDGNSVIATPEQVDTATIKYFGKKLQTHKEKSYSMPCADGEVFTFSQLGSLEDLGGDMFKAEGTIYCTGSGGTPDVQATPEAWKKAGEEVEVSGKFSALVKSEGERYILVEYTLADAANTATEPVASEAKPDAAPDATVAAPAAKAEAADLSLVMKDCFDWNMLDDKGKLDLLKQMKVLWRSTGAENDKNAIEADALLAKVKVLFASAGDQSNIFDLACQAAGIDQLPFRELYEKSNK